MMCVLCQKILNKINLCAFEESAGIFSVSDICFFLPFLRLLSRQSLTVRRLSVRKSYNTFKEKAWRKDSRPARRVFALKMGQKTKKRKKRKRIKIFL